MKTRKKAGVLMPAGYVQYEGFSTAKKDPGEECPKCGGRMSFSDGDDTIFCQRSFDQECDFQYTFTERELQANEKKLLDEWDEEAREKSADYIKEHGRPVFGQTNPEHFILPSHKYKETWG